MRATETAGAVAATDAPTAPERDGWSTEPNRLRDLRGADRGYALALFVLVLVPFVVAITRAYHQGWIPSGDQANIALRAFDVFTRHPPLTGLPSTSSHYGDRIATNHPGPFEFYLLAIPLRVLGSTAGPLLTAAAINAAFALVALWVVFRRLGTTVMLWAGVVMLAVIWSAGTAVLTDTLSSNMTMYSLLCTAVLAWALVDGDLRLLPLAAFVASYAAQQHLAAGIVVAALGVTAIGAIALQVRRRRRTGDTATAALARRAGLGALVVAVVCWVPVALNEIFDWPGNLVEIARFSADNTRPTMGFNSAIDQVLHAVTLPTILAKTDTSGTFFLTSVGLWRGALGVVVIALLAGLALRGRRRDRALGRLALVALVLLVAGYINGGNVPLSTESWRVNLYRWEWAADFLIFVGLGIVLTLVVRKVMPHAPGGRLAPVALLLATALIATAVVFVSGADDQNLDHTAFALEQRVTRVVLGHVDRSRPILVVENGYAATVTVGPTVVYRLARAGFRVEVQDFNAQPYGASRRYRADSHPAAILISSGPTSAPPEPGRLLTSDSFTPERTALLDRLTAAAQGQHGRLVPGAVAALDRRYFAGVGATVARELAAFPGNARDILQQPLISALILDGTIRGITLDPAELRRLSQLPSAQIGGDEVVQVRYLTSAQLPSAKIPGL